MRDGGESPTTSSGTFFTALPYRSGVWDGNTVSGVVAESPNDKKEHQALTRHASLYQFRHARH